MTEIQYLIFAGAVAAVLVAWWLWKHWTAVVVVQAHELALNFRHGRLIGPLAPGRHRLIGRGHEVKRFDGRWQEFDVPGQEFMTADRVGLRVSAVAQYRITEVGRFVAAASRPVGLLYSAVQVALREVVGSADLDELLARRADVAAGLRERLAPVAEALGLEIGPVSVKDLSVSGDLKRVFADTLTARQQSLVTIEKARAEAAAMRTMANAARVFDTHPALMQLKFLQALENAPSSVQQPFLLGTAEKWLGFLQR